MKKADGSVLDAWAVPAALFAACLPFLLPYLRPLDRVMVEESYLQFASYIEVTAIGFLRDHRLLLWAQQFGGGYPFISHPDNMSLSPFFYLLMLPFGTAAGMKLLLVASYAAGAAGIYLLTRKTLAYPLWAAVAASLMFLFNSFIPFQVGTGNFKEHSWFYLPLSLYFLFRSREDRRFILATAAVFTLQILNGFSLDMAPLALFLLLFAVLHDLPVPARGEGFPLTRRLLAAFALACLLSAVKLFPVFQLLRENDRGISSFGEAAAKSMSRGKLVSAFMARGPFALGNEDFAGPNGLGVGAVMYFGGAPLALLLFSCAFAFKRVWRWLVLAAVFILLDMGRFAPLDLFRAVRFLPLFRSIHEPARYFSFPLVLLFPLIACAVFSSKAFLRQRRATRLAAYGLAFLGVVDMFVSNRAYYAATRDFQRAVPPRRLEGAPFSVQVYRDDTYYRGRRRRSRAPGRELPFLWTEPQLSKLPWGLQFYTVRQGLGLTDWFGNLDLKNKARPRFIVVTGYGDYWKDLRGDPTPYNGVFPAAGYRGEAYFADAVNKAGAVEWRTNAVDAEVAQTAPGRLVVNQNFAPGWTSDHGKVEDDRGLLSVVLDSPVNGTVRLRYRSPAFFWGLLTSLASLAACALLLLGPRAARARRR